MTCCDVTITSQNRHFEFEAAILNPKPAVIQLTMTSPKIYDFFLRNILCQNKHTKVKNIFSLQTKGESWKNWKKTEKRQKTVKIHFWGAGCYGNVNHHRYFIDTGKFSLTNLRRSHEIWWLFVEPFKKYKSVKLARAQSMCPPGRIGLN